MSIKAFDPACSAFVRAALFCCLFMLPTAGRYDIAFAGRTGPSAMDEASDDDVAVDETGSEAVNRGNAGTEEDQGAASTAEGSNGIELRNRVVKRRTAAEEAVEEGAASSSATAEARTPVPDPKKRRVASRRRPSAVYLPDEQAHDEAPSSATLTSAGRVLRSAGPRTGAITEFSPSSARLAEMWTGRRRTSAATRAYSLLSGPKSSFRLKAAVRSRFQELDVDVGRLPASRPALKYFEGQTIYSDSSRPNQELTGRVQAVKADGSTVTIADHTQADTAFYPLERFTGDVADTVPRNERSRADQLARTYKGRWVMSADAPTRKKLLPLLKKALVHTEEQFEIVVFPKIEEFFDGLSDDEIDDIKYLVIDINQHFTACSECYNNIVGRSETWKIGEGKWRKALDGVEKRLSKDLSGIAVVVRLDAHTLYETSRRIIRPQKESRESFTGKT